MEKYTSTAALKMYKTIVRLSRWKYCKFSAGHMTGLVIIFATECHDTFLQSRCVFMRVSEIELTDCTRCFSIHNIGASTFSYI